MFESEENRKKRVGKACDSCRMKKTKCDGLKPCSKCSQDNKICTYSEKKKQQEKSYSSGYVELLENRIEILQSSLQKLVVKIANHEDVEQYVPSAPGEVLSINKVIELLGENNPDKSPQSTPDYAQHSHHNVHEDDHSVASLSTTASSQVHGIKSPATTTQTSSNESSPWSSGIEENQEEDEGVQNSKTLEPLDISGSLSLGSYSSGAALAAAVISGQYHDDVNSPLSATSKEELSPVPWGTVSPADLGTASTTSLSDLVPPSQRIGRGSAPVAAGTPNSSSSSGATPQEVQTSSSLPHHINNGAYGGGHISKLHRAGSMHHVPGQNQLDWTQQRNNIQLNHSQPYSSYRGTRRRDRSLSKASAYRAPRHRSADNVNNLSGPPVAPAVSSLSSASSYSSSSPSSTYSPGEAAPMVNVNIPPTALRRKADGSDKFAPVSVESAPLYDDDASFAFGNMGQFVQMEELNSNLDELWLDQLS